MSSDKQVNEALEAIDRRRTTIAREYNVNKKQSNKTIDIDDYLVKQLCKLITIILLFLGCWKLVDLVCNFISLLCMSVNN